MLWNKNVKGILIGMIIFSLLGIFFAYVSVIAHYNTESSTFCAINETFDCDVVNQSSYSVFLGIPVAILGLLAYVFFLFTAIAFLIAGKGKMPQDGAKRALVEKYMKLTVDFVALVAVLGLAFSLYLTSIEAFVLKTWCIMCIGSQICILVIVALAFQVRSRITERL